MSEELGYSAPRKSACLRSVFSFWPRAVITLRIVVGLEGALGASSPGALGSPSLALWRSTA